MRTLARLSLIAVGFGLLTLPGGAAAQTSTAPTPLLTVGARVRVKLRGGERREARLVSIGRDSLVATLRDGTDTTVAVTEVRRLEVFAGRHRAVARGTLMGVAVGVGVGAIAGAASYSPCNDTGLLGCYLSPGSRTESAAFGGVVGGALGLLIGAGQGLIPRDQWQRVPLDGSMRVGLWPLPSGGRGVGLALAF